MHLLVKKVLRCFCMSIIIWLFKMRFLLFLYLRSSGWKFLWQEWSTHWCIKTCAKTNRACQRKPKKARWW